jgi:hypothetical protein
MEGLKKNFGDSKSDDCKAVPMFYSFYSIGLR